MDHALKLRYFEYILSKLLDWQKEAGIPNESNDLSILKSLKLLFFISAIRSTPLTATSLIDLVFNDYWAMPFGHVELSIYKNIVARNGELNYFFIDDKKTIKKSDPDFNDLNTDILTEINESIKFLKQQHFNLIKLPAFALVDISHAWYSWQLSYNAAISSGKKRQYIEPNIIKAEDKSFALLF